MPLVVTSSSFTPAPTTPPSSEIMSCTCYLHHATEPDRPLDFLRFILCTQIESTVRGTHILSPVARPLYARRTTGGRVCVHVYICTQTRCPDGAHVTSAINTPRCTRFTHLVTSHFVKMCEPCLVTLSTIASHMSLQQLKQT
jgi:hypothetical protein